MGTSHVFKSLLFRLTIPKTVSKILACLWLILCMGISNEIKVTSITIDEATILEIKARIRQLPFQSGLTMLVV